MRIEDLVVHFYISPECKMNCPFCYAFEHYSPRPPLSTPEVIELIKSCSRLGAKAMVFCGGDPFGKEDMEEYLKTAKGCNMVTRIDSNLLSFQNGMLNDMGPYLDWIALPLDGPNCNVHDAHRNWVGHFDLVMQMIQKIQVEKPNISLKLHTLVTKKNIDSIFDMIPLIKKISPMVWSVYTYFRAGVGRMNYRDFELTESQIERVKSLKKYAFGINHIDIVSSESHNNAYIFLTTDGRIYRQPESKGEDYCVIGDFRTGALDKALENLDRVGNRRRASVYRFSKNS